MPTRTARDDVRDPRALAEARVGTVLCDAWRLDRLIDVGGMSAVYEATHRDGRRGALKLLSPQLAVHPSVKARFLREGYIANEIRHPAAVGVLEDHQAKAMHERLAAAMTEPAPSLGIVAPELPLAVIDIVDRALAFQKDQRWPDARAMQAAVRAAYAELGLGEMPSVIAPRSQPRPVATRVQSATTVQDPASVRPASVTYSPGESGEELRVEVREGEATSILFELRRVREVKADELPEVTAVLVDKT